MHSRFPPRRRDGNSVGFGNGFHHRQGGIPAKDLLVDQGAAVFAEVGFGGVLSNLVKRIDRKAARPCIQDAASFDAFVSEYAEDKE